MRTTEKPRRLAMRMERSFSCSAAASERAKSTAPKGGIASADSSTLPASVCTSVPVRFLLYVLARLYSLYQAYLRSVKTLRHIICRSVVLRAQLYWYLFSCSGISQEPLLAQNKPHCSGSDFHAQV